MRILFLDQSGKLGGAELSLLDLAQGYSKTSRVALFQDGPFRQALELAQIPVTVLGDAITLSIDRDSSSWKALGQLGGLFRLVRRTAKLARSYDLLYANTLKALVVGALVSFLRHQPLVYHLRDILSEEHFSRSNLKLAVFLSNHLAQAVIANSEATSQAFIDAGGRSDKVSVVYNGFLPENYQRTQDEVSALRVELDLPENAYVVGHFSRLSPWKGQHVLVDALKNCPENTVVLLVGEALFGEEAYGAQLRRQVADLELGDRVRFLGFRSDVATLMAACDLVTHTSTSPEPFGRVIVEAMLCGTPVIAAAAGGAAELVETGKTGWLIVPDDVSALAEQITWCYDNLPQTDAIARHALFNARQQFHLRNTKAQVTAVLSGISGKQTIYIPT
jgi:glycosyltransferase involved in cell wall biosynthesis